MTTPPLFFDLDGTVLDVSGRHYRVYARVTRAYGGEPIGEQRYWRLKRERLPWPDLLAMSAVRTDQIRPYLAMFVAEVERADELARDECVAGAIETLGRLRAEGFAAYLVTLRHSHARCLRQLAGLGLACLFTDVLSGHTDGSAEELKASLIASRSQGARGVVIGDTEADVLAGQRLAMTTVAVTSGLRSRRYLRALRPDYVLDSVAALPRVLSAHG